MNEGLIPNRYAKALFDFAYENHEEQFVYDVVARIQQICERESRVRAVLNNPTLTKKDKKQIINTIAGNETGVSFVRFIDLLVENHRDSYLQRICRRYMELFRKKNNIHCARLTTAAPVDKTTETRIVALVQNTLGGTIEVEHEINPKVLGGFQIDVDSNRWDATLAGQLQRIKSAFVVNLTS